MKCMAILLWKNDIYPRYSKNQDIGTRMPGPTNRCEHRVNYLISEPTPHKFASFFFPQERKEERANQNSLLPRLPKPGRSPALQLQPVADLTPSLTWPGYFSRTVSIKQSGNHALLGTSRWNPVACPHIKLSHHFGGLLLKSTHYLCAAGASTPAHRTCIAPRKRCGSTLFYSASHLCPSTKTHSRLHVKQHTPQIL